MQGYISFLYNSGISNIELSNESLEILRFFVYAYELTAYDIFKTLEKNNSKISYKNTHKKIQNLSKLKLIEKTHEDFHKHGSIFYKLTTLGVFYILSLGGINTLYMKLYDLERFKEDEFFQFFVFPYFYKNTIFKLKSAENELYFFKYFEKISNEIKSNFKRLDKIMEKDKYLDVNVIYWNDFFRMSYDEQSSDDVHGYLLYLKEYFDLDWLNPEELKLQMDSRDIIRFTFKNHVLELIKDDTLNKVDLIYNDKILETYLCKKLDKDFYKLFLRLDMSVEFYLDNMISQNLPEKMIEFIRELSLSLLDSNEYTGRSKLTKYLQIRDKSILKKDLKFIKILNETKQSIDIKFNTFIQI